MLSSSVCRLLPPIDSCWLPVFRPKKIANRNVKHVRQLGEFGGLHLATAGLNQRHDLMTTKTRSARQILLIDAQSLSGGLDSGSNR